MRSRRATTCVATAALVLAGCSGSDGAAPAETSAAPSSDPAERLAQATEAADAAITDDNARSGAGG